MKNLILILFLILSFSSFAQEKDEVSSVVMSDQTDVWMSKISSDSEMRVIMMDMIIENTKGNEVEMTKIVTSISNDSEMYQMIVESYPEKASSQNISINPLGIDKDSIKVGVMLGTQPVPKPKQ
ncbi:MAG: hypothetical protein OQJ78_06205 [Ignavibacteriaceae bacterium]|nr:hypothetical protein [Ignavibacteriaceae bacterium]